MNLHAQILAAEDSADFTLLISAVDKEGTHVATITSMSIDDPNINTRLRDISQAFRMGARFGKE